MPAAGGKDSHKYVVPPDLPPLLEDMAREILKNNPNDIYAFLTDYLEGRLRGRGGKNPLAASDEADKSGLRRGGEPTEAGGLTDVFRRPEDDPAKSSKQDFGAGRPDGDSPTGKGGLSGGDGFGSGGSDGKGGGGGFGSDGGDGPFGSGGGGGSDGFGGASGGTGGNGPGGGSGSGSDGQGSGSGSGADGGGSGSGSGADGNNGSGGTGAGGGFGPSSSSKSGIGGSGGGVGGGAGGIGGGSDVARTGSGTFVPGGAGMGGTSSLPGLGQGAGTSGGSGGTGGYGTGGGGGSEGLGTSPSTGFGSNLGTSFSQTRLNGTPSTGFGGGGGGGGGMGMASGTRPGWLGAVSEFMDKHVGVIRRLLTGEADISEARGTLMILSVSLVVGVIVGYAIKSSGNADDLSCGSNSALSGGCGCPRYPPPAPVQPVPRLPPCACGELSERVINRITQTK